MLLDAPSELRGLQVPPLYSLPEFHSSAGDEAIELAAMAGLVLDPWQQFVLRSALAEKQNGLWAAFEVALLVSRQNGKGSIIEARELAALFLLGEMLTLHSAHEFKTCAEGFRRLMFLIENTPDFDRRVKKVTRSHGDEGVELKSGQRIRFIARTGGSGRGFSGDCIILDEAMILSSEAIGALLPTLSARPNPQVWYTSSAGMESSTQLARVVRRGRKGGDPSLAYFDWCAAESLPETDLEHWAADPENWARSNPAMGIRITQDHIAREFAAMNLNEFLRERLGMGTYPAEDGSQWEVISESQWTATADISSTPNDPVAFAIDVTPDRSTSSIAVAGQRGDGMRHIEIIDRAPGTSWVSGRLKELKDKWSPKAIALDTAGPAGSLLPDLERVGIKPLIVKAAELSQACGAFYDAVVDRTVFHRGQMELTAAVKGARKRSLGDAWAWSRRDASVDISPLVAATIALYAHGANVGQETESEVWFLN